ncbi:MAG TPA: hypothetical protein VF669_16575 [Tepidisphaeraceae bacterium]|jgi:uncharacterized protein YpmS
MRRWTKRLLACLAVLLFAVIIFCSGSLMLYKGTPDWYASKLTKEKVAQVAHQAEEKLTRTQNWAVMLNGDAVRSNLAHQSGHKTPATRAEEGHDIRFSQDELNALFDKWSGAYGWSSKYGQYLEEPRIVLKDGRLILAALVKDVGAVVSFHFVPKLDEKGMLHLDLVQVLGGRLPLPDAVWDGYKQKMIESLHKWIPIWQQTARVYPQGAANPQAMYVTLSKLVLHAANHEPAESILFLPLVENAKAVPVKVTDVGVDNGEIDLNVRRLNPTETAKLAQSLREPA